FMASAPSTSYWAEVGADYGTGAVTVTDPMHVAQMPMPTILDSDIKSYLAMELDGTHPEWPTPDGNAVYVILLPPGVTVQYCLTPTTCMTTNGYHDSVAIGSARAIYAVIPRHASLETPGGTVTGMDAITGPASHEIFEAITDPNPV